MSNGTGVLQWNLDPATKQAAQNHPLPITSAGPKSQFQGKTIDTTQKSWQRYVIPPGQWPAPAIQSSPGQIVTCFQARAYLEALVLVVSWGAMWRTAPYIYGRCTLQDISNTLDKCTQSIKQTSSINQAWDLMTGKLGWTQVMTSKTLHFMCRALDFNQNPPVPIDGGVIIGKVWPAWKASLPPGQAPGSWRGAAFPAYERYMTAITVWASTRAWTTTDTEATIFAERQ